jgi:hypothetical protein
MTTYEQLVAAGAENCHPVFIGRVSGKMEVLARDVDGTVYLTDAGKQFLASVPAKKTRTRATEPQVAEAE